MVDALVVPVGGGGMVAGIAITVKVRTSRGLPTSTEDFILHRSTLWYLFSIPPQIAIPSDHFLALEMEALFYLATLVLIFNNFMAQIQLQ